MLTGEPAIHTAGGSTTVVLNRHCSQAPGTASNLSLSKTPEDYAVVCVWGTAGREGAAYYTFNGHFSLESSIENAEIMENLP